MKKAICAAALAAVLIFAAMIHGAAADKKGVRICFIVDAGSIVGCADGTSPFDKVLGAVIASGEKTAFFFDDENMNYDADYATAMMKVFASGMPIGIFDMLRSDDGNKLDVAMINQKYITRTVSRMVLTDRITSRAFSKGYSVYTTEVIVSSPELITEESFVYLEETFIAVKAVRISESVADAVAELFGKIKQSGIYIITPTETGFYPLGMEE